MISPVFVELLTKVEEMILFLQEIIYFILTIQSTGALCKRLASDASAVQGVGDR
jgi:hypothetical protein